MTKRELESEIARLREQNAALTKMLADALARPVVPIMPAPISIPSFRVEPVPTWPPAPAIYPPIVVTPTTGDPLPLLPYNVTSTAEH